MAAVVVASPVMAAVVVASPVMAAVVASPVMASVVASPVMASVVMTTVAASTMAVLHQLHVRQIPSVLLHQSQLLDRDRPRLRGSGRRGKDAGQHGSRQSRYRFELHVFYPFTLDSWPRTAYEQGMATPHRRGRSRADLPCPGPLQPSAQESPGPLVRPRAIDKPGGS